MSRPRGKAKADVAAPEPRVLISYARSDGEDFARKLRQRLVEEEIPVWQDRIGMEGGRDWWLQITDALNQVEFMVLVMTPAAMKSEVVRKEWRYARKKGKCVYPVRTGAVLDVEILPRWMRDAHFYDLEHDWRKFINDLNTSCHAIRVPLMLEDLPADFVPRKEFDDLLSLLLEPKRGEPIAITAALRGAGGYGKTTLANALCHDERIQEAFDDGILWITLGQNPGDLTGRVADLIEILTGERPGFKGIEAAATRFAELLGDRDLLIVIDDVWNAAHLDPFLRGGPRCARLITTRNLDTLPPGAKKVNVDRMRSDEATSLLSAGLPTTSAKELQTLSHRLGEWPLLLKLVNGTLRSEVTDFSKSVSDAFTYVSRKLDERGLLAFDAEDSLSSQRAVSTTIEVSLDRLKADEKRYPGATFRFYELAVFPEDAEIPLETLAKLWSTDRGPDEFGTEELCRHLYRRSLLLSLDLITRRIRLHDVVRKYLIQKQSANLAVLHHRLLKTHRPSAGEWVDLPREEPYFWDHLADHLIGAGGSQELVSTVKDLRYLAAKTFLRKSPAVEGDLLAALAVAPADSALAQIHRTYIQSVELLNRGETGNDVAATLNSRVQHLDLLRPHIQQLEQSLVRPCLAPWHPLPDLPHPRLIRTLDAPNNYGCAVSADGTVIVTASTYDKDEVVVWDVNRGVARLRLTGHEGVVQTFAINGDGTVIASASADGTLKIWDSLTGTCIRTLAIEGVTDCSMSADAKQILMVSAGILKIVKLQDESETIDFPMGEESVNCCAISADGMVATAGVNQMVMVSDLRIRARPRVLRGHGDKVNSCAVSANGSVIVSGSDDGTLRIWNAVTGSSISCSQSDEVCDCDVTSDGATAISLSNYGPLKLWDARTGAEHTVLQARHPTPAYACALSAEGKVAVSQVSDGTIKVWDGRHGPQGKTSEGRTAWGCSVSSEGIVAIAAYQDGLEIWDGQTGTYRLTVFRDESPIVSCAISADGQTIACTTLGILSDDQISIWDMANVQSPRVSLRGKDCKISSDGRRVAYVSGGAVCVRGTSHSGEAFGIEGAGAPFALSRDGRTVVARTIEGGAKVWDVRTGTVVATLDGRFDEVLCFGLNQGATLLVASDKQGVVRVFDVRTGEEIRVLRGRSGWLRGCAITDDGLIVSASSDGSLALWDAEGGRRLNTVDVTGFLFDCAWFPDGEHIVAVGTKGVFFFRLLRLEVGSATF